MKFEKTFVGRPNTVKTYTSLWEQRLKKEVVTHSAKALDEAYGGQLMQKWIQEGLSDNTIKVLISLYRKYVRWAYKKDLGSMRLIYYGGKGEVNHHKAFTRKEASTLERVCRHNYPGFYLFFLFGLDAGLRRGEVFGLRHVDISMDHRILCVERSYEGPTKSGRPRCVPLSDRLARTYSYNFPLAALFSAPLFPEVFDPNYILRKACKHAGVPVKSFHALRHTFCTLALEAGHSAKQVQEAVGHSKVSTTLDLYWSSVPQKMDMGFLP